MNASNFQSQKESVSSHSYDKGNLFEKFIIKLFNEDCFTIQKHREAKLLEYATLPYDHSYPDLELIFVRNQKHRFAVECKWRKKLVNGKINWAKNSQIDIYRKFQSLRQIPVFVAIGIGGQPFAPEKLFVTPLDEISNCTEVYESELFPYKRKPTNRFFYDTVQLKLF
jgi:hypothetical protein